MGTQWLSWLGNWLDKQKTCVRDLSAAMGRSELLSFAPAPAGDMKGAPIGCHQLNVFNPEVTWCFRHRYDVINHMGILTVFIRTSVLNFGFTPHISFPQSKLNYQLLTHKSRIYLLILKGATNLCSANAI